MSNHNVSQPIYTTSIGWFRYNYSANRLEFIRHETKEIVEIWNIPCDQWEALSSKRDYCENIFNNAVQQRRDIDLNHQREKENNLTVLKLSAPIAILCGFTDLYWYFTDMVIDHRVKTIVSIVGIIAFGIASYSFFRNKEL